MITFPNEFKKAISQLPSDEKDKLILRLLKQDLVLANRLLFELIGKTSVEEERDSVKKEIKKHIDRTYRQYYSPGILLMETRYASGYINDHVSKTKDKFGEPNLNLFLLIETLERNQKLLLPFSWKDAYTFNIYVIAKTFKILLLINKLHEDYLSEFRENLKKLSQLMADSPNLMKMAINNGLDVNWLWNAEIPENIDAIHKQLRAEGFLK